MVSPAPVITGTGAFIASSNHYRQQQLYVTALSSSSGAWLYSPLEDGWVNLPNPSMSGAINTGGCGAATSVGPSGTATAGSTTSLTTTLTLARDLRGYAVHITGGPGAGDTRIIASNTVGASSVIAPTTPFSAAITSSSTFRLMTPRWYISGGGTPASGGFKHYDFATNVWSAALAFSGMPTGTGDCRLISTPSWVGAGYLAFGTGTATSGSATTLINTAKAWTVNQWTNSQVRIVLGTGAGQIRTIISNTSNALTFAAGATLDSTSVYSIEGNDDNLYLMGNVSTALYKYAISTNTWSTVTPGTARGGITGNATSGHWICSVTDTAWNSESAMLNGRFIYSLRGASSGVLDQYDIAANTWNVISYAPGTEGFGSGTKYAYNTDFLYIQKDATGRWLRYNFITGDMDGWGTMLYPNGANIAGDTAFDVTYMDGATKITYIYMILNTSTVMMRQMVI